MPNAAIRLKPGIQANYTPTLNEGGWSTSQNIRFKDGLPQKIGGWQKFVSYAVGGVPREMRAWQDTNSADRLAVGTTTQFDVISSSGALSTITPQTKTTDFAPKFSVTNGSAVVTVIDTNISNLTTFDSVFYNTPISIGGLVLVGPYQITLGSGTTYTFTAETAATSTVTFAVITGASQANPCQITAVAHGYVTGQYVTIQGVVGMTQLNNKVYKITNTGANTFTLNGIDSTGYTAYVSGGVAYGATVPCFSTSNGSTAVTVTFEAHGLAIGDLVNFPISTTVAGVTIFGTYNVVTVPTADTYTITASAQATSTVSTLSPMNSSNAEAVYYITLGPAALGLGYGTGGYGTDGYGAGTPGSAQTGTPITATDWTIDNWGSILLACPQGGGCYSWDPSGGFTTLSLINNAPLFATGLFVSAPVRILVAYGATSIDAIGEHQDPLIISWSDVNDFTNWTEGIASQAGTARIPSGSRIVGAIQSSQQALIWTDLDVYSMSYVGAPIVFNFNKIGNNCGLIGRHAMTQLNGVTFWLGQQNFYVYSGAVQVLPCTVWDVIFQDLDTTNASKCYMGPNEDHSEVWLFYPSRTDNTGECSRYVKFNLKENAWDYGTMTRSVWIGRSVLGQPMAATPAGIIYRQETGYDADGSSMSWSIGSGDIMIAEGANVTFVDQVWPNMQWGTYPNRTGATVQVTLTFFSDYSQSTVTKGPYNTTASTSYFATRGRGNRMQMQFGGDDLGSFARLGNPRYRASSDGRRG